MALTYVSLSEVKDLPRPTKTFDEMQPDWDFSDVKRRERAGGCAEEAREKLAAREQKRAAEGKSHGKFANAVLKILKSGRQTAPKIANQIGRSTTTTYKILERLMLAGRVERLEVQGRVSGGAKFWFRLARKTQ